MNAPFHTHEWVAYVTHLSVRHSWGVTTAYSLQLTAYSLQPTAYSLQPTAYSRLSCTTPYCIWSVISEWHDTWMSHLTCVEHLNESHHTLVVVHTHTNMHTHTHTLVMTQTLMCHTPNWDTRHSPPRTRTHTHALMCARTHTHTHTHTHIHTHTHTHKSLSVKQHIWDWVMSHVWIIHVTRIEYIRVSLTNSTMG